jgi:hypothetical protein
MFFFCFYLLFILVDLIICLPIVNYTIDNVTRKKGIVLVSSGVVVELDRWSLIA